MWHRFAANGPEKMATETPATKALKAAAVAFETRTYDYDPKGERVGLQAAEAMGEAPSRVLKTLIAAVDGKPVCIILASDREARMKKVAAAFGGKSAAMMPVPEAERITGYKVGGVSPMGQRRRLPTCLDAAALDEPYVYVNGGKRGLQVRLSPADLAAATGASVAAIAA